MTEIYPFAPSSMRVNAARDFLPVLRAFVAPMLPEPISLRSLLRKIFVNIKPKGTDPKQ